MGMPWSCYGHAGYAMDMLDMPLTCYGHAMDMLDMPSTCYGHATCHGDMKWTNECPAAMTWSSGDHGTPSPQ